MLLSKHFTLEQLVVSKAASRLSQDIQHKQYNPPMPVIENLRLLCVNVLDPLYEYAAKNNMIMVINSGYRCLEVNNFIGGSKTSDHLYGRAADIEFYDKVTGKEVDGRTYLNIVKYCVDNFKFYQLIWEYGDQNRPGWIHIAYRKDNKKKQILRVGNDTNRRYISVSIKDLESYVV